MKVVFAPEALEDLGATVEYIAARNPDAAARLAERVFGVIESLAAGAFEGPEVRLRTGQRVRSWPAPPLRVYYVRTRDALEILRIYHQACRPLTK